MQYASATNKAEAVARMYHLGGKPVQPLGPGGKEKRSALEALASAVDIDVTGTPGKAECGRHLADAVRVAWNEECYSTGGTITLLGLNRLVDGVVEVLVARDLAREEHLITELMELPPAPSARSGEQEGLSMQQITSEAKQNIAELIATLSREGVAPAGATFTAAGVTADEVRFDDGSWRELLASVQVWLAFPDDLDAESAEAFDASLVAALGLPISDADEVTVAARLTERLEQAIELREKFDETLEDEAEGGATIGSASQAWSEAWAEIEDEETSEGSGPIKATAHTWSIIKFVTLANYDELELSPSYQRADVWPTGDAQALIESVLRGIPLPSVILLQQSDSEGTRYEAVDGKQRLTSILRFTGNHPSALKVVREKAVAWGEPMLEHIFRTDYPAFKKLWKQHESDSLTAQVERSHYFPFPLRKGEVKPLSGDLAPLRGRYYSQIREDKITVVGQKRRVQALFEEDSDYKLPVIVYEEVTTGQVHEVFSLYNKQGKHLNAEEIRNALYHRLPLMKALLVTAGDNANVSEVAPFLAAHWDDLSSTPDVLDEYGFGKAGYKRTKLLSWVAGALLVDDGTPMSRSTAGQINALLKTVQDDKKHRLWDETVVLDAMLLLDHAVDAHASIPPECWAPQFKSQTKWQELQLVGTLIALAAARAVLEDELDERVEGALESIQAASASAAWKRPAKTQSRQQWMHTGRVVASFLDILGVDAAEADQAIAARFGQSGLRHLVSLAEESQA
ncbi:DUF262 domain-containing protein [Demequina subtropica]|uniref:DUF262 domain-containing protein n=1 Tax=Demequina subtropica TaxID=1638989 RepID=UPI0007816058|nr:DUF262 domain-containing protein [Demequina subtropica]